MTKRVKLDDFNSVPSRAVAPRSTADLADLLAAIQQVLLRFVVLTEAQVLAVVLWVAQTHAFAAAEATPYLSITSAEKKSGKTRLLEVLDLLVARPWFTGRTTAAALVRKIAKDTPTLLLDESDAAFGGDRDYSEALRGTLNSGHRRGGCVSLCVGQGAALEVRDLPVFSAKAIAGIGKLPDTVADRAIPIRLKRRASAEQVERFRRRVIADETAAIREALEAWARPSIDTLRALRPALPNELDDRAADGWEPLLAIADQAGGEWPERARRSAISLMGAQRSDDSTGVQLLVDIHRIFNEQGVDRLASAVLLAELADEASPWADWRSKGPLRANALATLLKPFEIRPRTIRLADGSTPKGYLRDQFTDAFERYLPASTATTAQAASQHGNQADAERHTTTPVAARQRASKPHGQTDVADVEASGRAQAPDRRPPAFPLPGDPGYLNAVADAHTANLITTAEALELERTHRLITRTRTHPSADRTRVGSVTVIDTPKIATGRTSRQGPTP